LPKWHRQADIDTDDAIVGKDGWTSGIRNTDDACSPKCKCAAGGGANLREIGCIGVVY